jgi:CRP-like cAMP-binding protein
MTPVMLRGDSPEAAERARVGGLRPGWIAPILTRPMSRSEIREERLRTALRSTAMFRGLSAEDLARLQAIASLRDYQRGEALWQAGDAADAFTLIVRGRVKVVGHGPSGDVIFEIFESGEPVGAIAVYDGIPYPAAAVAMEAVTLVRVPRAEYFHLLDRYPQFGRAVMRELTRLSIALLRKLRDMRGQKVEMRIARLFLTLAKRMEPGKAENVVIALQLTRQEIAELVGTTVESAIRVLSRWGREGLVVTHESSFAIPSLDRLREVAEGEEDFAEPPGDEPIGPCEDEP